MNILYLHGLLGSLNSEKRETLEKYGTIYAPTIPYKNNSTCIDWLYQTYKEKQIEVVIGSSMGGFTGYYLSRLLQTPALLFNPALAHRTVRQEIPSPLPTHQHPVHFTLGAQDEVVNPKETMGFIATHFPVTQNYQLHIQQDLAHRIPLPTFKSATTHFFASLSKAPSSPKKYLFLDDIRTVDMVYEPIFTEHFDVVRSYKAFVEYIKQNGLPYFISFDNDLGLDNNDSVAPDGYAAAKWLEYESGLDLKNLQFAVHSANPVAAEQIRGLLHNYIKFLKSKG